MRKFFVTTFVLAAMLCLATSGMALEKRAHSFDDNRSDDWNAGATCRVSYYNTCTGWVWCWSGFGDGGRIGLVVDSCCGSGESAALLQSAHFLCSPAPSGYGFTGTIAVHSVDANNCPVGAPIASQPYLPAYVTFPFSTVAWGGVPVPNKFAIVITTAEDLGIASPAQFGTDHPAAGPTGPAACGTCYPSNRPNHSFAYGTVSTPACPGSTFNDGICNAQLFWDIDIVCAVSVEESSWGSIKGLYR